MASSADDFLKTLLRSGLVETAHVQAGLASLPKGHRQDPQALAQHFVHIGLLTQFQASKLLQGVTLGLQLGPYRILTPIGKGGMGMVYLGIDQRNKQHVAVKVLSPQKRKEGDRHLARFVREMRIAERLMHPHLVIAQDIGRAHDVDYLAMEYIPGQTLFRMVTTQGPLSVARAAHLFAEVASALEYAHSKGLIHRDMKPANIMVTPNDHAKVLDLGLAIYQDEPVDDAQVLGGKGHVVGTFDYIAPEQTRDASKVDPRADVYALGCSLYFALTGRPPFPAGTSKEKIQAHRHQQPEPLNQLNPTVPEGFSALVRKMMDKNPDERFDSMTAVRAALLPWAAAAQEKPLDERNDTAFQAAVAALEAAPVAADASEMWAFVREAAPTPPPRTPIDVRYWLLVWGVVGVWLLVILLFALIIVIR
jgi:serine/threonine protein kinase